MTSRGRRAANTAAMCVCVVLAVTAHRADAESSFGTAEARLTASATLLIEASVAFPSPVSGTWDRDPARPHSERNERPSGLAPLYVSLAALQALDIHSTLTGVRQGRQEANPVVAPLAREPALLIGTKTALALTTIALSERLWRKHRAAAILLMIAVNAAHAAAVAHNYRQLRR